MEKYYYTLEYKGKRYLLVSKTENGYDFLRGIALNCYTFQQETIYHTATAYPDDIEMSEITE